MSKHIDKKVESADDQLKRMIALVLDGAFINMGDAYKLNNYIVKDFDALVETLFKHVQHRDHTIVTQILNKLKETKLNPLDEITEDKCHYCGHHKDDHHDEHGDCWSGAMYGNKCTCRKFVAYTPLKGTDFEEPS